MKVIKQIFLSLLFLSVPYAISHAQENKSYFSHTIEKGQNLYSISSMYNVTTAEIIRLNPGCEEKIVTGQSLKIPQSRSVTNSETFHTIQTGETLYKLTTIYGVSAKLICEANPGLSADNFRIGQVIRIPSDKTVASINSPSATQKRGAILGPVESRCKEMHTVEKKETLFSLCNEYKVTQEELIRANPELKNGVKKGMLICIPYPSAISKPNEPTETPKTDSELFEESKVLPKPMSTVKAALLLPFTEDKRMVEYYEGFLIAVDSLKRLGTSIDLYAYDCTKDVSTLNSILAKEELKSMDVIFGPAQSEYIKPISTFTQKNNIRLVIPFSSKVNDVFNNSSIYQINTPQSYL